MRVCLSEADASLGQPLDVGSFIETRRAVERGVAPAEIVGQDEEEIGPLCRRLFGFRASCPNWQGRNDQRQRCGPTECVPSFHACLHLRLSILPS